jgi:heat shock protein HslJ
MGLSLAACSAVGARPSASADPTTTPPSSATPAPTEPTTPSPTTPPTQAPSPSGSATSKLDGRQFVSVLVTDKGKSKALVAGTKIRLNFNDGQIGASAGCNSMGGDYQVVDGKLVVGQMATTEIGCPTNLSEQDEWLATFLGSKPGIAIDGSDLVLTAGGTEITMLDREVAEPDQPLAKRTWSLTTVITGDAASSVPEGMNVTLLFDDSGSFTFTDGCNSGGGQYATNGDKITFSQVVATDMACDTSPDHSSVTAAVDQMLNADDVTFEIDHATLTLQAGDNGLQYDAALDVSE